MTTIIRTRRLQAISELAEKFFVSMLRETELAIWYVKDGHELGARMHAQNAVRAWRTWKYYTSEYRKVWRKEH